MQTEFASEDLAAVVEAFVPFDREVSIIAARSWRVMCAMLPIDSATAGRVAA